MLSPRFNSTSEAKGQQLSRLTSGQDVHWLFMARRTAASEPQERVYKTTGVLLPPISGSFRTKLPLIRLGPKARARQCLRSLGR
jgi:hypothetical protein